MKTQSTCLILLFILKLSVLTKAQTNEGTDFWFGFMEHLDVGQNTMVVMITSKYSTSGTVRIPLHNWQQNFSVAANAVTIINLPAYAENTLSEFNDDNGVQVVSQLPVSVYIHQYHAMRSEASVVLPVNSMGMEYYVMSYTGYSENEEYPSEFVLVGVEDETNVDITVSDKTKGGRQAGETFSIQLHKGETYQVQALLGSGDLTASHVSGNKKFNLFGGCRWTKVPSGCLYRDNLLEQMYPVSTWGKQFVTAPFAYMPYDVFRILAAENNTKITVSGQTSTQYNLNAGEFVEYQRSDATFITANHPIAVAQYLIGSACAGHNGNGDPSMLVLNSVEQIRDTVTLYNSSFEAITENYIALIAKTSDIAAISFDGQPLSGLGATTGQVGPNGEFSYARLQVNTGAHTIISEGCGVIAMAYGYGDVESYAYGGGASFKPIDAKSLIPEGGCLNDTLLFDTKLKAPRHTFLWDLGDGATSTEAAFSHVYAALGSYKVTLYLTDNCLDLHDTLSRDVLITLRQPAQVVGDVAVCLGKTIQLGAVDLPGAHYTWTGPNGFFSPEQFPVLPDAAPVFAGTYQVTGTISGCASYPADAEVTVFPLPQPILGRDTVVCPDESNPLLVLDPGNYLKYQWSNLSHSPTFEVEVGGQYAVLVEDENGCTGADSIEVQAICPTKYYIPNVFSPNDDGENDYFSVFGKDMLSLQLSVYDRWGNHLFESASLDARWDGTFRGKPVGPGVYTWVAKIGGYYRDGTTYETVESGSVTVVR